MISLSVSFLPPARWKTADKPSYTYIIFCRQIKLLVPEFKACTCLFCTYFELTRSCVTALILELIYRGSQQG